MRSEPWVLVLTGGALFACGGDGGPVETTPPPDTTPPPGAVQRAALTVTVTAAGEGAEVVELLGGPAGRVPEADVTIRRSGESGTQTGRTDGEGRVRFEDLLPGRYALTALRLLTESEARQVAEADPILAGVNALGGGGLVDLAAPSGEGEVEVMGGRRGSLVISEVFPASAWINNNTDLYRWARYLEVYNNADTTVYLDGKILVFGFWFVQDPGDGRCESLQSWIADPEGIWSEHHVRFPGPGRSYPVLPGQAKVVAMDAIDHSELVPGLPDLSAADFECIGQPDVDNPAVPNMEDVGFRRWDTALGHGCFFGLGHQLLALVDDVDLQALPVARVPVRDPDYRRFPADRILDVLMFLPTPEVRTSTYCPQVVHPRFDRAPAEIYHGTVVASIVRKTLGLTSGGRAILQRTGTSAADFERGALTPGRVP